MDWEDLSILGESRRRQHLLILKYSHFPQLGVAEYSFSGVLDFWLEQTDGSNGISLLTVSWARR